MAWLVGLQSHCVGLWNRLLIVVEDGGGGIVVVGVGVGGTLVVRDGGCGILVVGVGSVGEVVVMTWVVVGGYESGGVCGCGGG